MNDDRTEGRETTPLKNQKNCENLDQFVDKNIPICLICHHVMNIDQPYSILNSPRETSKYHVECLEQWVDVSNIGILSQEPMKSYSIYHDHTLLETLLIKSGKHQSQGERDKDKCCIIF